MNIVVLNKCSSCLLLLAHMSRFSSAVNSSATSLCLHKPRTAAKELTLVFSRCDAHLTLI